MVKKAFCVGINDYPYDGSDLNGCVNDALGWAELLRDHYDFAGDDVKVITDSAATKANIVDGLKDLLAGAQAGDVLVFTNSSHGSYQTEQGGDEMTYDEVLCPYDTDSNVIVDDELRELFSGLPKNVSLTIISDSCHSGTVTRAALSENLPGFRVPDDRRVRFLNPALRGQPVLFNPFKAIPRHWTKYPESKMNEILISGCTDKEYSYDAFIEGKYHGAMSYYALKVIRLADYKLTYAQLISAVNYLLDQNGFNQHPQLEGKSKNKKKQLFT